MGNLDSDLQYQDIFNLSYFKTNIMKKQFFTLGISLFITLLSIGQTLKIDHENAIVDFNFVSEKTTGTVKGIQATIIFDAKKLVFTLKKSKCCKKYKKKGRWCKKCPKLLCNVCA